MPTARSKPWEKPLEMGKSREGLDTKKSPKALKPEAPSIVSVGGWCPGNWLRRAHQQFLGVVCWWDISIYFSNHTNFKSPLMLGIIQLKKGQIKVNLLCDFDGSNFRVRKGGIL